MSSGLANLLAASDRLYALQEPGGRLSVRHGSVAAAAGRSLRFHKFHFPRVKTPSPWKEFAGAATWEFSQESPATVGEAPPLGRPAGAAEGDREAWGSLCEQAAAALEEGRAKKLVVARELSFPLAAAEYESLLAGVADRLFFPAMENAWRFLVKSGRSVFFGATPELLFRREAGVLHVPAIAGTRALVPGTAEGQVREELLASAKERAEHAWVVDGITESLRALGLEPAAPAGPAVLRVPGLLHLHTPITAPDDPALPGDRLLEALHPTPAIGGYPRGAARDFLFEQESFDRGLFSAPLLFRTPERELCLVAIRSALLTPTRLHFFAGAGYVHGSTPGAEWNETEKKLAVLQSVLFGEG
jgi:salicylate biosynthesis isochorismate synthase